MRFKKGESGNIAGRRKGAKGKTSEQMRQLIQSFVEDNWNKIQEDFDKVKPCERLRFIDSMIKHFLPDPINFERLSESQLEQLHEYLKKKYNESNIS